MDWTSSECLMSIRFSSYVQEVCHSSVTEQACKYSRGHKTMIHFKILVQVRFTTIKTTSQEVRKHWKNFKHRWRQSLVTSLPSRNETLVFKVKNYARTDIKFFLSCLFLLDFLTLFRKFWPLVYREQRGSSPLPIFEIRKIPPDFGKNTRRVFTCR